MPAIHSTKALGAAVRKIRKSLKMTQAEAAGACGVGVRFLSELENGKPTVQLDSVLAVVSGLGLELRYSFAIDEVIELPNNVAGHQQQLAQQLEDIGETALAVQIKQPDVTATVTDYYRSAQLVSRLATNQLHQTEQHAAQPDNNDSAPTVPTSSAAPKKSLTGI